MADLKTWKNWSCVRSDYDDAGNAVKDRYFKCDFKRNFASIGIFNNINIHLTYGYQKDAYKDDEGVFQIAITQHQAAAFDRVYDGEKKIQGFICTDKDKILNEFKKIFENDSFLTRYFSKAFE